MFKFIWRLLYTSAGYYIAFSLGTDLALERGGKHIYLWIVLTVANVLLDLAGIYVLEARINQLNNNQK